MKSSKDRDELLAPRKVIDDENAVELVRACGPLTVSSTYR